MQPVPVPTVVVVVRLVATEYPVPWFCGTMARPVTAPELTLVTCSSPPCAPPCTTVIMFPTA